METNFTFSCENWVDTESPLTVEFSHEIKGVRTIFFFREIPTGARVSATLWLPAGRADSEHRLNVSATVKDTLGGKAREDFVVEVLVFTDDIIPFYLFKNQKGYRCLNVL